MKINRLKLVNFIGIKHGLDMDSVEIDFTTTKNKIIMLLGGNGAGKSVIMSMLHPFKESFDDRKDLILEGKVGEKEIDITHDGHLYEIKHTYTKSAQSFIKKDGVELNENGGVRTFEEIIFKELGLTKDYFKIGKIGSNTKNFVDFTTADRKNYIGTFLNIDDIIEKHDIANNTLKTLKRDITSVGNELGKFQKIDVLETSITNFETSSKEIEDEIRKLYGEKGSLLANVENYQKIIDEGTNISVLNIKIAEKQSDITTNKTLKDSILEELPDVENITDDISKEISDLQTNIEVKNSEIQNKVLLLTDYKNKLVSTQLELDALGNPEDIQKTEKEIVETRNKMNELSTRVKTHEFGQLVNMMLKNKKDIQRFLDKTVQFLDFIEKYYTNLRSHDIMTTKSNISMFFEDEFEDTFTRIIKQSKELIQGKRDHQTKFKEEKAIKETYICQLKNLEKRPAECNIDTCPFIKDAYEHRNVISEITEINSELKSLENDIESLQVKSENLQEYQTLYINFKNSYNLLNVRDNDIYLEFVKEKPIADWVNGSLSDFQNYKQRLIEGVKEVVRDCYEYNSLRTKLINLTETKKMLEDTDSTVRSKYNSDILEMTGKVSVLESEIEELKKDRTALNNILTEKQRIFSLHEEFICATSKLNSASTMLSTAQTELKRLLDASSKKADFQAQLDTINIKIAQYEASKRDRVAKLDSAKASLSQVKMLTEKLNNLNKQYGPVSTVVDALSPKSGIPLVLMEMYLEETQAITNDLLDIAFGGDFKIKFILGDKDFSIQVESKGNTKSDIKMASQGEIAITTISISLALIEQSIGGYNILCLDEIDGNLDSSNRSNFMDILESQINKLGIEQVFVISHNDAFDAAPVGMVLLKGNNINKDNTVFMENKDVIFDIEGVNVGC